MSKRDLRALPPATTFLTLEETAARWRRSPITTRRLLRQFGVTVHRLTSRDHLYAIAEIEAIERKSQLAPAAPARNFDKMIEAKAKQQKELASK
jgi:hypothetical protein